MWKIELACIGIVLFYVGVQLRKQEKPLEYLWQYGWFLIASWCAENTVIHAYHFYAYDSEWSFFLDQVPLCIVLIWPVVIHSGWQLIRVWTSEQKAPYWLALMVCTDASLIEPISVQVGLWTWFAPGLFGVPPIGILGWAYFAGLCVYWLQRFPQWRIKYALLGVFWVVGFTHFFLCLTWWGGLRWVSQEIPTLAGIGVIWIFSLFMTGIFIKSGGGRWFDGTQLLLRIPAALFFYVLIFLYKPPIDLVAYSFAFIPPYFVLTWKAFKKNALKKN